MVNKLKIFLFILLICTISVSLVACGEDDAASTNIKIHGIVGISEVSIDAQEMTISATVTNQLTGLDIALISVDSGVNVRAYTDKSCTAEVGRLVFQGGINVYYLKCSSSEEYTVWKLVINQLLASQVESLIDSIKVSDDFRTEYEIGGNNFSSGN